ncbi:MAG: ribonuclease Z [Rectinema sp.]
MRICFFGTSSAIPCAGNGYTSFLLESDGKTVLVDTGDNAIRSMQEMNFDPLLLDGIILTHEHADHLGALPALIAALECMNRSRRLQVIMPAGLMPKVLELLALFDYYPEKMHFEMVFDQKWHDEGIEVNLLPGNHSEYTMMPRFVAEGLTMIYTSDIRYREGQYAALGGECHTLIHEATYSRLRLPEETRHSSAFEAGLAASEIEARKLFLCHFQKDAYENDEAPRVEASQAFGGEIIIPRLMRWYPIKAN